MRRIVRGVLWIVKGVLLAIALAALFLWPWSYWHEGGIMFTRCLSKNDNVEVYGHFLAFENGKIDHEYWRAKYVAREYGRQIARASSSGWDWRVIPRAPAFAIGRSTGWELMRRSSFSKTGPSGSYTGGRASASSWALVLVSGAWPATSIVLLMRRTRRRRLARAGCCAKCGYDLRASPDRCPECGALPEVKA